MVIRVTGVRPNSAFDPTCVYPTAAAPASDVEAVDWLADLSQRIWLQQAAGRMTSF